MSNMYQSYCQPLTKREQINLHARITKGDKRAKDIVISSCLPLVINISKKFRYNNKHIDIEDMIQEGNIALMKAVDNWDINKGNITTVATWYIKNTLIDMVNDSRYSIKYPYSLSRRAAEELRKVKKVNSNNIEYVAKETGLSKKRVKTLLSISPRGTTRVSLGKHTVKEALDNMEEETTANVKPCLGDLIDLINTNLRGDQRTIFCLWAGINRKKIGPKEIANTLGKTEKYVYDNIYSAKRILAKIVKIAKVRTHA